MNYEKIYNFDRMSLRCPYFLSQLVQLCSPEIPETFMRVTTMYVHCNGISISHCKGEFL